jgi:hypothetical protein
MLTKPQGRSKAWFVSIPRSGVFLKTHNRIGIIASISIACAVAMVTVTLGVHARTAAREPELRPTRPPAEIQLQAYEGLITDTKCGAKHSAVIGKMAADCALACVRGGEQFALVDGETTYLLEGDPVVLKRGAGQRVKIMGTLNGRRISASSVVTTQ